MLKKEVKHKDAISYSLPFMWLYVGLIIFDLACMYIPLLSPVRILSKPALLVSLLLFFMSSTSTSMPYRTLILTAIGFSLLGDLLLLFTEGFETAFVMGLSAFLLAHICYSVVFARSINWPSVKSARLIKSAIAICSLASILFAILYGSLGALKLPVLFYVVAISTMTWLAFCRLGSAKPLSYRLVALGATFFMISDSVLAINRFYVELPMADLWVMTTYATAQYCIVQGLILGFDVLSSE